MSKMIRERAMNEVGKLRAGSVAPADARDEAPEEASDDGAAPDSEAELDRSSSTRTGGYAPPAPAGRSAPKEKRDDAGAPPPPQAPKKEGLVDLAKRLLRPFTQGEGAKDAKAEAPRGQGPGGARRLNGKVRRQGKRLIIEIDVTSVFKWAPGGEARLELSDGTIVKAPVLMAMTTGAGEYGLGLTITLVLEVDERVGEPATVHLSNGSEVLEIVL